jgi:hypothetical protein
MTFLDGVINANVDFFNSFSIVKSFNLNFKNLGPELVVYLQFSSASVNITLYFLVTLTILNFIYNIFFKQISYLLKLLRFINLLFITVIITLLIIKFYFSLKLEQHLGPYLYDLKLEFFKNNTHLNHLEHFVVFSSSFSDAILILSFLTGLICLELLGLKNLFKNINNISLFYIFNFFVVIMVSTSNLLVMFISFEFIFLPTMFFVYKLGYSKKIDKANIILFS